MEAQKHVKIIGLELKQNLGIIKAHSLKFDKDNNLIVFKGKVGAGKTTEQKALQLGTLGAKTLQDAELYGDINTEIQLLDGETNIWVGCKSDKNGKLKYILYTKDLNGKIQKNPIIDGVKATPAEYLKILQTKLTWRIDEITSENPTVQRKILLELYQREFQKLGVIFEKKSQLYDESIIGKIDTATRNRDYLDMLRKQKGGIADDLKAQGIDPDRPDTVPDGVNIDELQAKITQLEKQIAVAESEAGRHKDSILADLKNQASEITTKVIQYNQKLKDDYNNICEKIGSAIADNTIITNSLKKIEDELENLRKNSALKQEHSTSLYNRIEQAIQMHHVDKYPDVPKYIDTKEIDGNIKVIDTDINKPFIAQLQEIRKNYTIINNDRNNGLDAKKQAVKQEIEAIKTEIESASIINNIVEAVDSFHKWREANEEVQQLKRKYMGLLLSINTGVEGLKIQQDDKENIYLAYDGSFNPNYFGNKEKVLRKVSAYSGTQKPIIALLIQNYLLSKKPKALRYMYIDNIPIDKNTRKVIEQMCDELNITIIMNITGDFDRNKLGSGEYLVENGEIFFA